MNTAIWIVGGAAAVAAGYFFFVRKPGSASGATEGSTWQLVRDAAPRVPAANGGTVPVWYHNAPVDPSQRWAALALQHQQDPKGFLSCIVVVVVQNKSDPTKKQALSVEVTSTESAADGSLTGRVVTDPQLNGKNMLLALGLPSELTGDDTTWPPALGTEISFTPSDTLAFLQP